MEARFQSAKEGAVRGADCKACETTGESNRVCVCVRACACVCVPVHVCLVCACLVHA